MSNASRSNQLAPAQRSRQRVDLGVVAFGVADARLQAEAVALGRASRGAPRPRSAARGPGSRRRVRSVSMSMRAARVVAQEARDLVPARRRRRRRCRRRSSECVSRTAAPKFFLRRSIKAFDMHASSSRSGDGGARSAQLHEADVLLDHRILARLDDARACGRRVWILSCSSIRPSSTASGRGGQPGCRRRRG